MLSVRRSVDRVNHVLRKHSGLGVNKLSVKLELRKEHADHIDGWVMFAIASKARIVTLNFSPYLGSYESNYSFPCHLFNSKNASYLQALRLDSVNLGPSPDFCAFANLKMLALDHVLALKDLQYILSKCPVLEWLSIQWCYQKCNLHASAPLCRLKYLCVKNCNVDKIEFVAPNLNTFEYRGSQILIKFHECSKLKTTIVELIIHSTLEYMFTGLPGVVPHVETLHVEAFVNKKMLGFKYAPLEYSHLRHLALRLQMFGKTAVLQLAYLLEAAPYLEDLHLDMYCYKGSRLYGVGGDPVGGGSVIPDRPHYHLKTGFRGNGGQTELAKYIMRNAVELERMTVDPRDVMFGRSTINEWYGRLCAKENLAQLDEARGILTIL
ncbi:unnamed protein product [Alopecurus aequalis]